MFGLVGDGAGSAAKNAAHLAEGRYRCEPWDEERFTEGDCHFLARAIHLRTGWPMMAFDHNGRPDLHAFVRAPDGRVVDVRGFRSMSEMQKEWRGGKVAEFDWTTLRFWFLSPQFGRYSYRRAAVVAERLLASRADTSFVGAPRGGGK